MLVKDSQGLNVEVEVQGYGYNTEVNAYYLVDGEQVSDAELEYIGSTYAGEIEEAAFQNAVMRAEAAFEGER